MRVSCRTSARISTGLRKTSFLRVLQFLGDNLRDVAMTRDAVHAPFLPRVCSNWWRQRHAHGLCACMSGRHDGTFGANQFQCGLYHKVCKSISVRQSTTQERALMHKRFSSQNLQMFELARIQCTKVPSRHTAPEPTAQSTPERFRTKISPYCHTDKKGSVCHKINEQTSMGSRPQTPIQKALGANVPKPMHHDSSGAGSPGIHYFSACTPSPLILSPTTGDRQFCIKVTAPVHTNKYGGC